MCMKITVVMKCKSTYKVYPVKDETTQGFQLKSSIRNNTVK